ncbi:MAG: membrane protein insertase YidC [Syntrophobacteraceae bacterium]|nr:membrane protein insertase YidC [Syntrophobacteraceae bacterium]
MEKRAVIAFALSLVILLFWDYYFGLFRSPDTKSSKESAPSGPVSTPSQPAQVPVGSPFPKVLPQGHLKLDQHFPSWDIDSPLFSMQLLAPGARIHSMELKKYRQEVSQDSPPMQMVTTRSTGYLPLAVDLLHHTDWQLSTRPFMSQSPRQIQLNSDSPPATLSLHTEISGQLRLTKAFVFQPDTYFADLEIHLENLSPTALTDQLGISLYFQPYSHPSTESSYNQSRLSSHEKGSITNHSIGDLQKKDLVLKGPIDWIGYENNYFIQALLPIEKQGYQIISKILNPQEGLLQVVYLTEPFQIEGGQTKKVPLRIYMGPKELTHLAKAEHQLSECVDYGWFTFLAKPLLIGMNWVFRYTHNYGIAIILLTIVIKIIFWPLTQKSFESMQTMKKIQPKIAQIREKYKNDREKLNQELMGIYRTYKVNPLGGCLPMLLQIPVFFALYRMLNGAIELRHEPFMLWINDLTAPDRLHIGVPIPYLDGIPVLTILMGISMFVQQKMTPTTGDPRQDKMMLFMPVVFTVFFVNFPSGLVLYWLVNNILSIIQQYWINRRT